MIDNFESAVLQGGFESPVTFQAQYNGGNDGHLMKKSTLRKQP